MILIIYCRSNAQADLSHRYMRIRQCSFCVVVVTSKQFLESILKLFEVLSLNDLLYKYVCNLRFEVRGILFWFYRVQHAND